MAHTEFTHSATKTQPFGPPGVLPAPSSWAWCTMPLAGSHRPDRYRRIEGKVLHVCDHSGSLVNFSGAPLPPCLKWLVVGGEAKAFHSGTGRPADDRYEGRRTPAGKSATDACQGDERSPCNECRGLADFASTVIGITKIIEKDDAGIPVSAVTTAHLVGFVGHLRSRKWITEVTRPRI